LFERTEGIKLGFVRVNKLSPTHSHRLIQNPREFLRQHNGDGPRIAGVNRNRERAGVPVVTVNIAFGFPNAVGMSGRMIVETDEKDFRPKIPVEGVLGLHDRQIITSGNDATVQDDEIVFAGGQNNSLMAAGQTEQQKDGYDNAKKLA
jgi:hypothetical protein